ncbi:MAG: glycoside hydrolase family 3 N-terminal domain-containing protein [Pseudomonas sp.]|uniref:glycoside hydrolase family 3 N-terminal domain-containing protein n=1 Tax=Pseudomonas sp. TaxID=306 RepID=UPI0033975BA8
MLVAMLRWLLAVVLLLLAWYGRDPHLLPVRPVLLLLLGVPALLALHWLWRRPAARTRQVWVAVLLLAFGLGLSEDLRFRGHRAAVLAAGRVAPLSAGQLTPVQRLGQHFVLGYRDPAELAPLVAQGLIGGVFITRRNIEDLDAAQIREQIAGLQRLRLTAGLPPLIVSTDQEGGIVSRLSPPLPQQPPLASLVAAQADGPALESAARAYGREQGAALAALGVDLNFSPVLDLKLAHPDNPLDLHSLIARRALSADPAVVGRVAQAYAEGLQQEGVRATLKHFPGLGRVSSDTHHFSAALQAPLAQLREQDWRPFRQLMAQTPAWVMLAHVTLTELDRDYPVSLSRTVVQRVLRQEFAFDGVLITDDLTMAAAYRFGVCQAAVRALDAGVDLLLVAYDPEQYYEALHCALQAQTEGRLDPGLLEQSDRRLARSRGGRG